MGTQSFHPTSIPDPRIVPQPPRLHWGWVLVLSAVTRSLFGAIWLVVQAHWISRVTGNGRPRAWAIVNLCAIPALFLAAVLFGLVAGTQGFALAGDQQPWLVVQGIIALVLVALYVTANFQVRAALEAWPIALPLGGLMTFFFGPVYFQYFLHDYVLPDAADFFGPIPSAPAYVPATSREEQQ